MAAENEEATKRGNAAILGSYKRGKLHTRRAMYKLAAKYSAVYCTVLYLRTSYIVQDSTSIRVCIHIIPTDTYQLEKEWAADVKELWPAGSWHSVAKAGRPCPGELLPRRATAQ